MPSEFWDTTGTPGSEKQFSSNRPRNVEAKIFAWELPSLTISGLPLVGIFIFPGTETVRHANVMQSN